MYTLQWERHYRKVDGKRRLVRTLVYRDKHGVVQGNVSLKLAQKWLLRQWQTDNEKLKIENLPASEELREKLVLFIRDLKRRGYVRRKIIYGTVKGNGGYRRPLLLGIPPIVRHLSHAFLNPARCFLGHYRYPYVATWN